VILAWLMTDSTLLVVSSTNMITLLDIRDMEVKTRFQQPLGFGPISAVCPSTHWLVLGSSSGILSLWDLRFGLLLKSWRVKGSIQSCQIHPSRGRGRWIMVSTTRALEDQPIVEVYDIETSKLVEVYEIRSTRPSTKAIQAVETMDSLPDRAALIAELAAARTLSSSGTFPENPPSVVSIIVGQSIASLQSRGEDERSSMMMSVAEASPSEKGGVPGWMVTAGEDRVVRYWDLAKPGEGFVICGSPKEKDVTFK
jgi:phosphoinositide-3-kinase regulatory subunit 4